jgi:hypothetical protein
MAPSVLRAGQSRAVRRVTWDRAVQGAGVTQGRGVGRSSVDRSGPSDGSLIHHPT